MLHGQTCRSPNKVSNFACKLIKRVMIHVNARLGVFCAVTGGVDLKRDGVILTILLKDLFKVPLCLRMDEAERR